ncbi:hypothetical protein [Cellulomonas pakistanensis]|uniref:DUF2238 domain-containing protein n=1 Tax=Cellulomonas pakistanensis TaxID=992287 RepID=A0A919PBB7_9CELL|nr:hypothetical protein [Cellulomonas pakistanensis]GIG36511.1 hypothetical protein Cpa01nite_18920 [Cellulomonas pakistanensis]
MAVVVDGATGGGMTAGRAATLLVRGPGGAVRVLGLASAAVAAVALGPVDAALLLLVLAGLVVPLTARVDPRLDAAYGIGLLASGWAGVLDLYQRISWLDIVMHLVVTGLIAAVGHLVVARLTGAVVDPVVPAPRRVQVGSVGFTWALGLALSVFWEVGEYLGNTYIDATIHVAYRDTIGDMVLGGLGSLVAGVALVRASRRRA